MCQSHPSTAVPLSNFSVSNVPPQFEGKVAVEARAEVLQDHWNGAHLPQNMERGKIFR